jgi:hypothetical protein
MRFRRDRHDKRRHALQELGAMMVIVMIAMVILPIVATPICERRQATPT